MRIRANRGQSRPVEVAQQLGRAAQLLACGISSQRALQLIAEDGDAQMGRIAHTAQRRGSPVKGFQEAAAKDADNRFAWLLVACLWQIAEHTGAPLAAALRRASNLLEARTQIAQRQRVLLAAPLMTVWLVSLLPLAALGLGQMLGFAPFRILATPAGLLIAGAGVALLGLGVRWLMRLIRDVSRIQPACGVAYDLVAVGLMGGMPSQYALRAAREAIDDFGFTEVGLGELRKDGKVQQVLTGGGHAGVGLSQALLAAGARARSEELTDVETRAERLAVQVLVPIATCVLPAFILIGIVPVLLSMMGAFLVT